MQSGAPASSPWRISAACSVSSRGIRCDERTHFVQLGPTQSGLRGTPALAPRLAFCSSLRLTQNDFLLSAFPPRIIACEQAAQAFAEKGLPSSLAKQMIMLPTEDCVKGACADASGRPADWRPVRGGSCVADPPPQMAIIPRRTRTTGRCVPLTGVIAGDYQAFMSDRPVLLWCAARPRGCCERGIPIQNCKFGPRICTACNCLKLTVARRHSQLSPADGMHITATLNTNQIGAVYAWTKSERHAWTLWIFCRSLESSITMLLMHLCPLCNSRSHGGASGL